VSSNKPRSEGQKCKTYFKNNWWFIFFNSRLYLYLSYNPLRYDRQNQTPKRSRPL
jgi:hypothetical protein